MNHHAVLIRQPVLSVPDALAAYGDTADCEVYIYPSRAIGIREVRGLSEEAIRRPAAGQYRLLLVMLDSITVEAEQALLKILEEPPASTKFLFLARPNIGLLPTVLSRFFVIEQRQDREEINSSFKSFLRSPMADRLEEVSSRTSKKDQAWIQEIKSGLAGFVSRQMVADVKILPVLGLILSRLDSRGASNKMLLEELALTLPISAQS